MTTRLPDLPPPQIHIVEASAGSGKTYTLARRYIQLLLAQPSLANIPLRQILAITFTNKAAFEMKQRVLEFLKKTALNKFSSVEAADILGDLAKTPDSAQEKAAAAMDHLIRNYNFFQVQTIDSFVNALLSGCAFKIDLSARFKIMRNYVDYLQYSLDELIDRAGRDREVFKAFENFLRQYLYVENKTNWFPKKDILGLLSSLFYYGNLYGGIFRSHAGEAVNVFVLKNQIFNQIRELFENLPEGTNGRFTASLEKFIQKNPEGFDVDGLSEFFNREEFPLNKGKELSPKAEHLWADIRMGLKTLVETEAFHLFDCYLDIFALIMKDFRRLTSRDDVLFLEELNRKARVLFDEEALTVAELYYRLASRFKHYLIDEFQDTSVLQWRNLSLMIEEALSTGGTLFYVGDKKQAIYRFRGGEVSLFRQVEEQFNVFPAEHGFLNKNYRSQKEIVDFNNDIFSQENLKRFLEAMLQDKKDIALSSAAAGDVLDIFKDARQTFREEKTSGFVQVERVDGADKEERSNLTRPKVLATIEDLRERFSWGDMAILTRDNDEVTEVTGWLLEAGIPVESDRTLNIKEHFLIKEIISLLKFLNSPIDNLSFASFILGDIFTRASKLSVEEVRRFLFEMNALTRTQRDVHYYKEFRRRFPEAWEQWLEEFFKRVGFYPLYELVVSIFHKFEIQEKFPQAQGFLMRFLELIQRKEEERVVDVADFLELFAELEESELYVHITRADAVKILTVHKSKGLEFSVVIIPFLGIEIQVGAKKGSYLVLADDSELKLLRLKRRYLDFSAALEKIYQQEYKRAFIDELNNIYVALTRAKEELYIFIPDKVARGVNFVRALIPENIVQRGQPVSLRPPRRFAAEAAGRGVPSTAGRSNLDEEKDEITMNIPPSNGQDWIEVLRDEFLDKEEVLRRRNLRKGEMIHFVLAALGEVDVESLTQRIKEAVTQAQEVFGDNPAVAECEKLVIRLLKHPAVKPFFGDASAKVFLEKEVIDQKGRTKRIDRLMEKELEVWVVDYKSSAEDISGYQAQVKEYMKIIQPLYLQKIIRGFLIYLDEVRVEEV